MDMDGGGGDHDNTTTVNNHNDEHAAAAAAAAAPEFELRAEEWTYLGEGKIHLVCHYQARFSSDCCYVQYLWCLSVCVSTNAHAPHAHACIHPFI